MEWFPFDQRKRYLTGIDWVINAFNYQAKKTTGLGNISHLVFELNGKLEAQNFCEKFGIFLNHYPLVGGRVRRDFNLCPYWRINRDKRVKFSFIRRALQNGEDALAAIFNFADTPLNNNETLSFFLAQTAAKSFLTVKFSHCLFDAAGIEAFLSLFENFCATQKITPIHPTLAPKLCGWRDKFKAGKTTNRFFLNLRKNINPVTFAGECGHGFNFVPIFFNFYESKIIFERALKQAGYLMFMPFALAQCLKGIDKITGRNGDYLVPVNVNLRAGASFENIFFNHLSFLFFRVSAQLIHHEENLCLEIKQQFFNQVKEKISDQLAQAADLMRIAPLWVVARLLEKFMGGAASALAFSYLGESAYPQKSFCNQPVINIFHLPIVPPQPGVGVFFTQYQGRLNVTVTAGKAKFNQHELCVVAESIRQALLA